jgi:hypothetical protein
VLHYHDNSGLDVTTTAATVEQPVSHRWSMSARTVFDYISVKRKVIEPGDPGANAQLTGHRDADVVTSASAIAGGGGVSEKWRVEGQLGATFTDERKRVPYALRMSARAAGEPDYQSYSAQLAATVEPLQRNLVIGAFAGGGVDRVLPIEKPPGEPELWPAVHGRFVAGLTLSQILSQRLILSGGAALTVQRGQLANPYRRAVVRTTLFPEHHPNERERVSLFVQLSAYLGAGTAMHYRLGFYADSWSVLAVIPEVQLARQFGAHVVASLRYRFYTQTRASFYQPIYEEILPIRSGDLRLGELHDHAVGLELRVRVSRQLVLVAGYDVSLLQYRSIDTDLVDAHIANLGLLASY